MYTHRRVAALAAGVAVLALPNPIAAGQTPVVLDRAAGELLARTAWATTNDVADAECTGLGTARKDFGQRAHARFRCKVSDLDRPRGVVLVRAMGPEWLRVTQIVSGRLKPDAGLGPLPRGTPVVTSQDAAFALQRLREKKGDVSRPDCHGVGTYRRVNIGYLFYAFSCSDPYSHGPNVLVTASLKGASVFDATVRIVRALD